MRLFDLHCDTLTECYRRGVSLGWNDRHIDLARGRRYAPWGQVFAVFIPDTMRGYEAFRFCCRVLEFARQQEARFPQQLAWVTTAEQLREAVKRKRCAGILAVESAAAVAGDVHNIEHLASCGVRVMTLTWNGENEWGGGCATQSGLTAFGKSGVKELHRVGIVPDVSHLSESGFWDVASLSERPFIASHSVCRAVHDHPRNLNDEQVREIVRRGGLIGLNFCEAQLGEASEERIYRHLSHLLSLGAERNVAFGGDLDGCDLPVNWHGIAFYERLLSYLLSRGISERQLNGLFFQNAFDFFDNTLQFEKSAVQ